MSDPQGNRDPHKAALYQMLWHLESKCGKQAVASWLRAYQLQRPKAPPPAPPGLDGEPNPQTCAVCSVAAPLDYHRQVSQSSKSRSPFRSASPTPVTGKVLGVAGRTQRLGGSATTPRNYTGGKITPAPSASRSRSSASVGMKQALLGTGASKNSVHNDSSHNHSHAGGGDQSVMSEVTRHSSVSRVGGGAGGAAGGHRGSWEATFITQVNAAGRTLGSLSIHARLRNETLVSLHNILQQSVPETSRRAMRSMGDPFIQSSVKLFQMLGFQLQANELVMARAILPIVDTLCGLLGSFLPDAALEGFVPRLLGSLHHPNLLPMEPEMLSTLAKLTKEAHQRSLHMLRYMVNHLSNVLMTHPYAASATGVTYKKTAPNTTGLPPNTTSTTTSTTVNMVTTHSSKVFFLNTEALLKMTTYFRSQILSILTKSLDRDSVKVRYLFDDMISPVEYVVPWHSTANGTMKALNSLKAALVERHHCRPDEVLLVSNEGDDIALQDATNPGGSRSNHNITVPDEEDELMSGSGGGGSGAGGTTLTAAPHPFVAAMTNNQRQPITAGAGSRATSRQTSPSPRQPSEPSIVSVTAPPPNLSVSGAGAAASASQGGSIAKTPSITVPVGGDGDDAVSAELSHMTALFSSPHRKKMMMDANVLISQQDALSDLSTVVGSPNSRFGGSPTGGGGPSQRMQVLEVLWNCLFEHNTLGSDGVDGEYGHITFSVLYVAFPAETSYFFTTRLSQNQRYHILASLCPIKHNQLLLKAQVFNYAVSTRSMLGTFQEYLRQQQRPASHADIGDDLNKWVLVEDQSASWSHAKPALRKNPLRAGHGGHGGSQVSGFRPGGGGRSERASVVFHDPSMLSAAGGYKGSEVHYGRTPSLSAISGTGRSMRSNNGGAGVTVFSNHTPFATPTATAKTTFHRSYTTNTYLTVPNSSDPLAKSLGQGGGGGSGASVRSGGGGGASVRGNGPPPPQHWASTGAGVGMNFDIPRKGASPPGQQQVLSRQLSEKRVPSRRPSDSEEVSPVTYPQ